MAVKNVELRDYSSHFNFGQKASRALWSLVWYLFFRPSPTFLHPWRRFLLGLFGAKLENRTVVHPSVKIWAPWNLTMQEGSCLGPGVDCYCVDKIALGPWAVVSQRAFLCTATHDIRDWKFNLRTSPIQIGPYAWVAAEAFVGPNIHIGEGAVVAARACVVKDVPAWTVVGGNPAKPIGKRKLSRSNSKAK